ncbi:aldehyde dehydrogenase (NADP(+)) [Mucilaginibacter daejeonensis]|uniref:aldehyde dehydrogenase (NADP(+)) n=1 Tax=Mucilaginibacter daejeonensis TaxID=398049 RepID=UPI001D172D49|nr:aldehyde dehydrogenase (NADP(+)) [Mucilaginibacter daejeonensis]UEG52583.1 aldehyde dehydrogenase (NADP(+)) [Mucilaginibacter daejeonensis]
MDGRNLIGFAYIDTDTAAFKATDPATGKELDGNFFPASQELVDQAMQLAVAAHARFKHIGKDQKAAFLRAIAEGIEAIAPALTERASTESGLPLARLQGELGRTTGQLRLFANVVEEGSWVEAVIDTADASRQPLPKPDIRKMLVPIGPVVVFGASNFPLAFSVAGGDTASALAAGCPVVVKAHPAHPGTSALVAEAIHMAAIAHDIPEGVFSILYDDSYTVGEALVKHPHTKAVTFTGSYNGGMALEKIARQRGVPIPVFAEMGSINPVILLPGVLNSRAAELANQYAASITLGAGQFCTNPGLLLAVRSPALDVLEENLKAAITAIPSATMLTPGIYQNYTGKVKQMLDNQGVSVIASSELKREGAENQALATVARVTAQQLINDPHLAEEVFGPYSLLVVADDEQQLAQLIGTLPGQLTVTFMANADELTHFRPLIDQAAELAGRIILNSVPTGVEVCAAMQHGGPFPATSDSRFTSVGTSAIRRFVRPLAWQGWDNANLPDELKDDNPLQIWRTLDQQWTKDQYGK